jgi:hypothetical protein
MTMYERRPTRWRDVPRQRPDVFLPRLVDVDVASTVDALRAHYASGINRTLQNVQPRRDQPYQTMQLMQFNWFRDKGVLKFDPASATLSNDYGRYHDAVESLLREVLALQDAGDPARSDAFIKRWATWDEAVHGRLAEKIREQQRYRYRLFTYAALGE